MGLSHPSPVQNQWWIGMETKDFMSEGASHDTIPPNYLHHQKGLAHPVLILFPCPPFRAFRIRHLLLPSSQVELPRECIYISLSPCTFPLSPCLSFPPYHPTSPGSSLDNVILSRKRLTRAKQIKRPKVGRRASKTLPKKCAK